MIRHCVHCAAIGPKLQAPSNIVAWKIVHLFYDHPTIYAREQEALWKLFERLVRREPWPSDLPLPGDV